MVYVFIHDYGRANSRVLNHFIYPQASFQVIYWIMLLVSWMYPMTTLVHLYNIFTWVLTLSWTIFVFVDGVTPAFGVTYLLEFIGQISLELIFISNWIVINSSNKAQKERKKMEEFKESIQKYRNGMFWEEIKTWYR